MSGDEKTRTGGTLPYLVLAKLVALGHIAFAAFAILGGFLVARYVWLFWPHMLAFAWSFATLAFDWGCPVTPLEKSLLQRAGAPSYREGFVQHYLTRTTYSQQQSRRLHILLSAALVLANELIYHFVVGLI